MKRYEFLKIEVRDEMQFDRIRIDHDHAYNRVGFSQPSVLLNE